MDLYVKLMLLGLVAGAVSAGTAVGWGLITAPVLLILFRYAPQEAVALSVLGTLGYLISLGAYRYASGVVPWGATLALMIGSLIGGFVGVVTVDFIPAPALKRIIGIMTIIAGLALLIPWQD